MNLFTTALKAFTPFNIEETTILDKFTSCSIFYYISNFKSFDEEKLSEVLFLISNGDNFELSFKIGDNDSILLKNKEISSFYQKVIAERKTHEDEKVFFKLEIKKVTNCAINIYDFKSFENFWETTPILDILKLIKKHKLSTGQLRFSYLEQGIEEFYTNNIVFSSGNIVNDLKENNAISDNCHFGNIEEYPFNAYFFHLNKRPEKENSITEALDKLCLMFCIISIFDITAVKDTQLYYKLNGYKSFEGYLVLDKLDTKPNAIYYKIFDWIYSENSKISDKIGLARNIISLSLVEGNISITESTYLSIQSGYKTYLQENISKYIEIRNKIVDELSWISQKAGGIIEGYLSNYQKSIFTFLSFFISVFVIRFLTRGDVDAVFSKDVTLFSLAFLLLSIIFLIFSLWSLNVEKKRLTRKYENIKNRYTDLLDINDINRILKNDDEYNYEINYINRLKRIYTTLWIFTIIVLIATILSISSYFNWSTIYISIIDCFGG
ncbi:MAG: hypothetical protein AB7S48_06610 [Bacteroidales bacterium]